MSIATEITRLAGAKSDLATSIAAKGVTVPAATKIDGYADLVDQIQQGGGGMSYSDDIVFIDYDGTIVETWTLAELQNKTTLPTAPTHEGLTFETWNWTLAELKTQNTKMTVGANYIPTDGKHHIFITIPESYIDRPITLYFNQSISEAIDFDWGDGVHETVSGTGEKTVSHAYHQNGDYEVRITKTSGSFSMGRVTQNMFNGDAVQSQFVREIWFAFDSFPQNYSGYKNLGHLEKISVPSSATGLTGNQPFQNCRSLRAYVCPSTANVSGYTMGTMYSLKVLSCGAGMTTFKPKDKNFRMLTQLRLPDTITGLSLTNSPSLEELRIPNSVTGEMALQGLNCDIVFAGSATLHTSAISNNTSKKIDFSQANITITGNNQHFASNPGIIEFRYPICKTVPIACFGGCTSLFYIDFPAEVITIKTTAIPNNIHIVRFRSTIPPTAEASNSIGILSGACIVFPYGCTDYLSATNYPSPSTINYIGCGMFEDGSSLPSSVAGFNLTWYGTIHSAESQVAPITIGNGKEVFCRYTAL